MTGVWVAGRTSPCPAPATVRGGVAPSGERCGAQEQSRSDCAVVPYVTSPRGTTAIFASESRLRNERLVALTLTLSHGEREGAARSRPAGERAVRPGPAPGR